MVSVYLTLYFENKNGVVIYGEKFFVNPYKSAAARFSKYKRRAKKMLIPGYGKKGVGWIRNPRQAAYNRAYKNSFFRFLTLFSK